MIWAAGNPQIYRGWSPKIFSKIQNFHLRKAGAAALRLHQKSLLSGFSTAAAPSKRRDAVMHSTRLRRGSAISAPRCYYASKMMCLCFSAMVAPSRRRGATMSLERCVYVLAPQQRRLGTAALSQNSPFWVFQLFFAIFLFGFDLLVISSNFPRFNLKITSKQVKSNIKRLSPSIVSTRDPIGKV